MSFLNDVRLVFSGNFQADMSTVNNDVRHFDNAAFQPSFQQFQTASAANGWWNPTGSGAFRLLGCTVTAAHGADGTVATGPDQDPVVGMNIAGSDDRSSGKLVDLDPQWQLASAPWGMEVRLADRDQPAYFSGPYRPHAFRDLWFGRLFNAKGSVGGDAGAAATFQSILSGVIWADDLKNSRVLAQLRDLSAATGALSIRLMTYGYKDDHTRPRFTMGRVVGVIGPHLEGEPESFVLGRRFAPASGKATWAGCSYFSGAIDPTGDKLFLDLSNGLQLAAGVTPAGDEAITVGSIGPLTFGILSDPTIAEGTPTGLDNFLSVGSLPAGAADSYDAPGWLARTGGVVTLPLNAEAAALVKDHPLAVAASPMLSASYGAAGAYGEVAIRETAGGLFAEAEPLVHRIDAPGSSAATLFAARYGTPIAATLLLQQTGASPATAPSPDLPTIPNPSFGLPSEALTFPLEVATGENGRAALMLQGTGPGNPRGYIDGQIYLVDFRLPGQSATARSSFDFIVVHVRDEVAQDPDPSWECLEPILRQYGNLYPIMSQGLFDISNRAVVHEHARTMRLAFSMPMEDPNHMPVTRDLSEGKRRMILAYLDKVLSANAPAFQVAVAADPGPISRPRTQRPPSLDGEPLSGKTQAARAFAAQTGRPGLA